jgi:hypothetical protein
MGHTMQLSPLIGQQTRSKYHIDKYLWFVSALGHFGQHRYHMGAKIAILLLGRRDMEVSKKYGSHLCLRCNNFTMPYSQCLLIDGHHALLPHLQNLLDYMCATIPLLQHFPSKHFTVTILFYRTTQPCPGAGCCSLWMCLVIFCLLQDFQQSFN